MKKLRGRVTCLVLLFTFIAGCKSENATKNNLDYPLSNDVEAVNISPPQALFTNAEKIKKGLSSPVIFDQLIALINAAPEGTDIYISIYQFQYQAIVDALKKAHKRGVGLNIMLDMSDRSKNERTLNELVDMGEDVEIVQVKNDASASAINHNKSVLFSKLVTKEGEANNIIFQTSQNFTRVGAKKIQDAVILEHQGLYEEYLKYWDDMKALSMSGMKDFRYREYSSSSPNITAFFHPKRKSGKYYGGDTIIELLEDVTDPSSTTIKVGMSVWTNSRLAIAQKLEELLNQGSTVEIITKSSIGDAVSDKLYELSKKGAEVKIYNMSHSDGEKINIHSKFMMIEGEWKGEKTNILINGTQNFSQNALRNNNETTLLFKDHPLFNDYESYFEELKKLPGICCLSQ